MSTDFFRKYLDLLNEAPGQPPTDFVPTHFHKNNLGFKIPLMQTPDGKFWWETTATSDDGGPVQRGSARKTIQPWTGDTEDRSSGLSGKSSVDGEFKDGKPVDYPEGKTWKDFANATSSVQTALPSKVKEIPHIDPGPLIAPNEKQAPEDPPGYRFSNDQALANLAAQMKDGDSARAWSRLSKDAVSSLAPTGSKTDSSDSLYLLKQIKGWGDLVSKLSDTMDPNSPNAEGERRNNVVYMEQLVDLLKEMSELPAGSVSDVTLQQVEEIYRSSLKKIKSREASVGASTQSPEKDKAVASGGASGASVSSDSGTRWAYVPGDGTSRDISGKKDGDGKAAADWGPASIPAAGKSDEVWDPKQRKMVPKSELSTAKGKETIITDSSHCAQCGTPKSLHAPLKHGFVAGDDVRPAAVGGSASVSDRSVKPSTDTLDADQARIDKMDPYDRNTRRPVGAKPAEPPAPPPSVKGPPSKPSFVKEDINRLSVVDQMRSWRQLMEADPPKLIVGPDQFDTPEQIRARAERARNAGKPAPPPPETPGYRQINPASPLGRAQAAAASAETMAARGIPGMDGPVAPPTPPAAPADWKAKVKFGLRKIANPAFAVYAIYQGWQQIMTLWDAHKQGKLSDQQFAAETTKIVAKLVEEYGIIQVSTWLGGAAGGAATGGAGAIPGMIAGAAAGIGLEHYFGDNISSVVNNVIDYLYSTDKKPTPAPAPAPQQNKLNPQQIGELKQYIAGMEAWVAAGNKLDQSQQQDLDKAKAMLKAAGVTVAPTPAPAADSVARYKKTFDKANAIVDKMKNLDPKVLNPRNPGADPKAAYNLMSELKSLFANEIGEEGQQDPAVAKQIESILDAAIAVSDQKHDEAITSMRDGPATGGPKQGDTKLSKSGKKIIYNNGAWEYAN
jgi:hypothetical protein